VLGDHAGVREGGAQVLESDRRGAIGSNQSYANADLNDQIMQK
jgi:hypothetical protein